MTWRSRLGLDLAPILLRIALGAVFIHAGAGKLFYTMPLSGPPAAKLVGLGLAERQSPDAPGADGFDTHPGSRESQGPSNEPSPTEPVPPANDSSAVTGPRDLPAPQKLAHLDPGDGGQKPDVTVELPTTTEGDTADVGTITVSRRLFLVLAMDGASGRGQWPAALSTADALNALAWTAALTEFIGGWLVLIGLMTRIWALGLMSTMAVAMWLTQIGPALTLDHGAVLGFLPPMQMDDPQRWTSAWEALFMQLTLLCSAGALALLGAGWISLDGLLFGGLGRHHPPRVPSRSPQKRGDTMHA